MDSKTEEKFKYFFNNKSTIPDYYDFSIPINEFEELLRISLNTINSGPHKNSFKVYGINNKFFKVLQDGSCFGYTIKKQVFQKIEDFYQSSITQTQIYNDDFAGLKNYWVEELYEEIIFKLDDQVSLNFSKMTDIPRNYSEYSIFLDSKNQSIDIKKYSKIIQSILVERTSYSICETTP